jgi:hypothetical protein
VVGPRLGLDPAGLSFSEPQVRWAIIVTKQDPPCVQTELRLLVSRH